jgi:hypothetical protein
LIPIPGVTSSDVTSLPRSNYAALILTMDYTGMINTSYYAYTNVNNITNYNTTSMIGGFQEYRVFGDLLFLCAHFPQAVGSELVVINTNTHSLYMYDLMPGDSGGASPQGTLYCLCDLY